MKLTLLITASWVLFYFLYTGYNLGISLGIALIEYAIFEIEVRMNEN